MSSRTGAAPAAGGSARRRRERGGSAADREGRERAGDLIGLDDGEVGGAGGGGEAGGELGGLLRLSRGGRAPLEQLDELGWELGCARRRQVRQRE